MKTLTAAEACEKHPSLLKRAKAGEEIGIISGDGIIQLKRVDVVPWVAESALLEARLLISSDQHLRGIDFERLSIELQAFDLTAPVIPTPAEVVRKFFRR